MNKVQPSAPPEERTRFCEDFNVMVAGQGGDGSLSIIGLLAEVLAGRGLNLYQTSNIASRIKGGHAAAMLRAAPAPQGGLGGLGDLFDVLVAFDDEVIELEGQMIEPGGIVIYDSSRESLPSGYLPDDVTVLAVPFSRYAVRELRRDLFKNCFGFGLLVRVLGLSDDEAEESLRRRFAKLSPAALSANLQALQLGFGVADELGYAIGRNILRLPVQERSDRVFMSGNEATAFGFLVAGGRFMAGYPITPATDIMDWLNKHAAAFGGVVVQAEDELSAVNLAIGAALTGARAMTASSGPGIALMQESVSHCGSAEIPLVVVDCQRAGPSTGMPTKTEQSDIGMLTSGACGDFPHFVLCPGTVGECFEFAVLATNLAQVAQCPVYIALDRMMAQDTVTVPPFELAAAEMDTGKLLSGDEAGSLDVYKRYAITEDGISPWAVPGTPQAMNLVTGNERNEWGQVSTAPANRKTMMDKRARKMAAAADRLPRAVQWGDAEARIGLVGTGMETGVMDEAYTALAESGLKLRCHRPRTLWPVLEETIEFIGSLAQVYVVEHSEGGQLAQLLKGAGAPRATVRSILKYDGVPFRPSELVSRILEQEEANE